MLKKLLSSEKHGRSLDASWKEGIPAAVMISVTDFYLIPLGLLLGAKLHEIGFLVAFPQLLGSIAQIFAVRCVDALGSRLKFLVRACVIQALILLPVAALPFAQFPHRVWVFIGLICAFRITGNLINTIWGSIMSDYLIPEERGRYLGWRNRIVGLAGVAGLILGVVLLYFFKSISPKAGFLILFGITAASRLHSAWLMSRMQDIPQENAPDSDFSFVQFLGRFRESNFVKFVIYVSGITFAAQLTAPYVSVHLLENLRFNYLQYMAVFLTSQVAQLISFPIWGRHADIVGNAKVLKITSLLLPFIPIYWMFVTDLRLLICLELLGGFVWGGFNLCSVNFIFDSVTPEKRVRCIAYFSLITGVALFLGASLGGFLADRVPQWFEFRITTLFLIGSCLRFGLHFILSRRFKETRSSARNISHKDLFFSVAGIRPITDKTGE